MKSLTKQELVEVLKSVKGNTFISIESKTEPKLKKGNPFNALIKISKVFGAIGFNYENSVNNQRIRESLEVDFEAKPRQWGKRIKGTPLVEHKDKYYLEVKVQGAESDYFQDNNRVDVDKIKPWMYNSKSRQGVEKEVIVRDYSLDNISRIKINKKDFIVV